MLENFRQAVLFLLDKSKPFDIEKVKILDQISETLYGKDNQMINLANQAINEFKNDADAWLSTDMILENSQSNNTKFISLIILEDAIKSRWSILPEDQKNALKSYIMNMIIKMGSIEIEDKNIEALLNKCNSILVQIIKYEWRTTWKNFIPEICDSSQNSQNLCENNLTILKMLSEEIFEFSKNQMTSTQIKELKDQMLGDFKTIFGLCNMVLERFAQNPQGIKLSLIKTCLETLYAFLSWIPLFFIFNSTLIEVSLLPLIDHNHFRNLTIKCLTEIVFIPIALTNEEEAKQSKDKLLTLFASFVMKINPIIPCDISLLNERGKIAKNQPKSLTSFDFLCQNLTMFFTGMLTTHLSWLETVCDIPGCDVPSFLELMRKALQYIVNFSELPEDSIFKTCVEFWHFFTEYLKNSERNKLSLAQLQNQQPLLLGYQQNPTLNSFTYPSILSQVRRIVISRMAKPQEVLIVIDENGQPTKEIIRDSENFALYEIERELMINLTILDWENTKSILTAKLEKQLDGSEWSFDNINSLCWAIGSISGTLKENDEKNFLITAIRTLLSLTEMKKGKENKAVVASNIMYVVGQYPKFLRANWNFLKTVVKKLFEFMHEAFPGVMEMSCNTFLKIATTCKEEFVIVHANNDDFSNNSFKNNDPYIYDLIRRIPDETNMLENSLKLVFFEAIGLIISSQANLEEKTKHLGDSIKKYLEEWTALISDWRSTRDVRLLLDETNLERIGFFLKVNERLALTVGLCYEFILQKIYIDIIDIYLFYSSYIMQQFQQQGKFILNNNLLKKCKSIRKDVIKLICTYLESTKDPQYTKGYIPPLLNILEDFRVNNEETKEADVLQLFALVLEKVNLNLEELVPKILELIFSSTLTMITRDFQSYPDHRMNFFTFLRAVISYAFESLFSIPADQFKIIINCVIWAFKHDLSALYELGLDILLVILKKVNTDINICNQFYQIYYIQLLNDILYVMTDSYHKSGFRKQAQILAILLEIIETGYLSVPVANNIPAMNNKSYVMEYIVNTLISTFPNISKHQTELYVNQMFLTCKNNFNEFKIVLRDYLVQLSTFSQDSECLN